MSKSKNLLKLSGFLQCPQSGELLSLDEENNQLVSSSGQYRYYISESGIPSFIGEYMSAEATVQQKHYDEVVTQYVANYEYPHTQEYMAYLDRMLLQHIENSETNTVAEICCGQGEAFQIFGTRIGYGIGVDVSGEILKVARTLNQEENYQFVHADATILPLQDELFDSVFMLGGIHHINNRTTLFKEIHRILKPGGKFYWREPVDDFFLWRWLRSIVYRLSSALDAETEHPLRYHETKQDLEQAGFIMDEWDTYGFLGFMLFMNSDVLVFNRLFKYIPGIRALTQLATVIDDWTTKLPGLQKAGLQVIGVASKD